MNNIFVKNTYQSFRLYLDEVYLARNNNPDLIGLSIGYPVGKVVRLSQEILDALSIKKAGKEIERIGYGWNFSTSKLKQSLVNYENTKHGTRYSINNIALTAGGTHAINKVVENLMNKRSDNLIVASPAFYKLFGLIHKNFKIIPVTSNAEESFVPNCKSIIKSVTLNTRIIFISNPSNPVYKFYPADQLDKIIKFCESKKIYVLLDEVGDAFRYTNYHYPKSIESQYIVRVNSASKFLLLAEYSLGYVVASPEIVSAVSKNISDEMGHIPFAGCTGWMKGLDLEQSRLKGKRKSIYGNVYKYNLNELKSRRDYTVNSLGECKRIKHVIIPDACFSLVFKIVTNKYKRDTDLFRDLLHKERVSLVPGSSFGISESDMFFRLTFAVQKTILKEGLARIKKFVESN